ncbi:hypothetical protein SVAN01_03841 [Stagonosporopsis vannaccii]|nr:hypothetical protein SVAN01_03841 [Stagonosporopsis vannaccii]
MLAVGVCNHRLDRFRQSTREIAVRSAWTRMPRSTPESARPAIGAFCVFLILVSSTSLQTYHAQHGVTRWIC